MTRWFKCLAKIHIVLAVAVVFCAHGQNIQKVNSDAVTQAPVLRIGATQTSDTRSIPRVPIGGSVGQASVRLSAGRATAASGKTDGYRQRASVVTMSEYAGVTRSGEGPSTPTGGDFIASMPKPLLGMVGQADLSGRDFGLTDPGAWSRVSSRPTTQPNRKLNPDAIRHPFTHPLGLAEPRGVRSSVKPTVGLGTSRP